MQSDDSMTLNLPKKGLKIAHINICSLRNKVYEVESLLMTNNVHILAISETHLDETCDEELMVHGYNIYRRDRNIHGGGVAFYILNDIPVKRRDDLMTSNIEALWLQVHLPNIKPILLCCCYRPPDSNAQYLSSLCEMVDRASDSNKELYILGDMNINWFSPTCSLKKSLHAIADACNLTQLVKKPTRIQTTKNGISSTCIDHIFTNAADLCSKVISVEFGCTDHNIVAFIRKAKIPKAVPKIIYKRSFKNFREGAFLEELENIPWHTVGEEENPEIALNLFMQLFLSVADKHAPIRKHTVKSVRAPWIDNEIKDYMTLRNTAKKKASESGSPVDWQIYCKLRNEVTKMNRKKKKCYYQTRINEIKSDSKLLWKTLNNALGRGSNRASSFIEVDGAFITKPYDIAQYFNNFFTSKVDSLRKDMSYSDVHCASNISNKIMKNKSCMFSFEPITSEVVEKLLLSIHSEKSAGLDNLDGKLLKLAVHLVTKPITYIFSQSLMCGVCPQIWKEAKVTPLPKNSKINITGVNSRPISILPVLAKLMEKYVFNQIQSYFSENALSTDFQHAYREGLSTNTALTQLIDDCLMNVDSKRIVGSVLLDFSAAFDIIDYNLLLEKLLCYGFTLPALKWIKSYLSGRSQRVYYNGSLSDTKYIYTGIPQGSCLGPLLFTIFTNDMPLVLDRANIAMYSDDTTLYMSATNVEDLSVALNKELQYISEWVVNNRMVLNISKTKAIVFGSQHMLKSKPKLCLHLRDVEITQVDETKLLGVTLDSQLTWSTHIENITKKMGGGLSMIRRCAEFLTPASAVQVIQALVISHLDYCPAVWSSAAKKDLRKLQIVQNKAARLALKSTTRSNTLLNHRKLSWLFVEQRLAYSLAGFF